MRKSVSAVIGLVAGGALVGLSIRTLAGTTAPLVWHAIIAVLGLMALGLAWRHTTRWLILPAALTLLAFVGLSFRAVPGLVRSGALEIADGRPFCILGAAVSVEPDGARRDPYRLSPALSQRQDLTVLARYPVTLVVQLPEPAEPPPFDKPEAVFAVYAWSGLWTGFTESWTISLGRDRQYILLDCEPKVDPFGSADASLSALIVMRDSVLDAKGKPGWGSRRYEVYRLPDAMAPQHSGRFSYPELSFTAQLLPGAEPISGVVSYTSDPIDWLNDRLRGRVRDADDPLDFSALAINDLGLAAYEVPSTSVASAIEGTYAAFGTDGLPIAVIACSPYECRHHMRADETGHRVLTLHYPPALLSLWRAFETAATAKVTEFLRSGD